MMDEDLAPMTRKAIAVEMSLINFVDVTRSEISGTLVT
jgi:hypothetical protein